HAVLPPRGQVLLVGGEDLRGPRLQRVRHRVESGILDGPGGDGQLSGCATGGSRLGVDAHAPSLTAGPGRRGGRPRVRTPAPAPRPVRRWCGRAVTVAPPRRS